MSSDDSSAPGTAAEDPSPGVDASPPIRPRTSRGLKKLWVGLRVRTEALWHWTRWRWRFAEFGWRARIRNPDLLSGTHRISIEPGVEIRKGARLEVVTDGSGAAMRIGAGTSIHLYFHAGAAESLEIGRNVLIAGHVYVTDHDHEFGQPDVPRGSHPTLSVAATRIGDDCWLGEGCKILKGVQLGQGCVVGAGAVVTRSFPAYTAVAGVPARAVRSWDEASQAWVRL